MISAAAHLLAPSRGAAPLFDDALAKWKFGERPGIAVALVRDGRITCQRTWGYADLKGKAPVLSDTRFLVGSISKQFTATAVLMLAQDGRLRLDDVAFRYVPDLPAFARAITIRKLLHQTGGLPDHEKLLAGNVEQEFFLKAATSRRPPFTVSDAFAALRASPGLNFAPGDKWVNLNPTSQLVEMTPGKATHVSNARRFPRMLNVEPTVRR